jgi:glycosyltransferase involved in cell wall biosynthesis
MNAPDVLKHRTPVLFLAYVYPPDQYSGAARPHRLAKYLKRLGHRVSVLAAGEKPGFASQGDDVYRVQGEFDHLPRKSRMEQVFRLSLFPYDEGATWIPRVVSTAKRWVTDGPRPVVISTSPPVTTHIAALWLKQKYGLRWFADFRDPLAGNPFRTIPRVKFLDNVIENRIFRNADLLIANTEPVAEMWREKHRQAAGKVRVLWNAFDPETVAAAAPIPARTFKVLAQVGSIYGTRQPTLLLASIERLLAANRISPEAFRVQLIGPANLDAGAASRIDRLTSSGILEFKPETVPSSEARRIISQTDYLLLLDVLGREGGLQVPAKLFEYIAIGRPILALTIPGSPVEYILSHSGIPHVVIHADMSKETIDRELLRFLALDSTPVQASTKFEQQFDPAAQARMLSGWIEGGE